MASLADALTTQKKRGKMKGKTVSLGKKGSFKITHPGWTRNKAAAAGMSTKQWSQAHKGDAGVAGRRARSALGLMAMSKGKG
jgi:hypothetical protein